MRTFCHKPKLLLMSLLLVPLLLPAAGCSSEGTLSGKVYLKGKAVTKGTVTFFPEGKGGSYPSLIESDGSYTVSKVPPGPAKISVQVGMSGPPPNLFSKQGKGRDFAAKGMKKQQAVTGAEKESADADKTAGDQTPAWQLEKYIDPERSGLTLDVTGGRQTHDIKLD